MKLLPKGSDERKEALGWLASCSRDQALKETAIEARELELFEFNEAAIKKFNAAEGDVRELHAYVKGMSRQEGSYSSRVRAFLVVAACPACSLVCSRPRLGWC